MGFYEEIANRCLIQELKRELNRDVLLLGVDGLVYFGSLQAVDDNRVALLSPATTAASDFVEILTFGSTVRFESFARVDLFTIIGKGTSIVADPFLLAPNGDLTSAAEKAAAKLAGMQKVAAPELPEEVRQVSPDLVCQLKKQTGDFVAIATLGGFFFEGQLSVVEDGLAILANPNIFAPGSNFTPLDNVRSAVVNLEALTAVGIVGFS